MSAGEGHLREGVECESGVAGRLADIAWAAGQTGLSGELHDLRRRLALLAATAPTPDEPGRSEGHDCAPGPLCDSWCFSDNDAFRTIAAVSWPGEREENRNAWAVTMRDRPLLFAHEAEQARMRLEAAIAHGQRAVDAARGATRDGAL